MNTLYLKTFLLQKFTDEGKMLLMKTLFGFLIAIFFCSCSSKEPPCDVLVSIPPYLYFVDQLSQGELSAVSLVPQGANPHLYEPTPKQLSQAKNAKVWIRLSENFETKIAAALQEQNPDLIVLNLAEKVPLIYASTPCSCGHDHPSHADLHIWLSLRSAQIQAQYIAEALQKAFPQKKTSIKQMLRTLLENFQKTDAKITQELAPYANQAIVVSHPAFGYLCKDYNLEQISIEVEGKDPLPKQIEKILQLARTTQVRTILTQSQYNNKGAILIAEMLQKPIHEVDPYSADYLHNFLHITSVIASP